MAPERDRPREHKAREKKEKDVRESLRELKARKDREKAEKKELKQEKVKKEKKPKKERRSREFGQGGEYIPVSDRPAKGGRTTAQVPKLDPNKPYTFDKVRPAFIDPAAAKFLSPKEQKEYRKELEKVNDYRYARLNKINSRKQKDTPATKKERSRLWRLGDKIRSALFTSKEQETEILATTPTHGTADTAGPSHPDKKTPKHKGQYHGEKERKLDQATQQIIEQLPAIVVEKKDKHGKPKQVAREFGGNVSLVPESGQKSGSPTERQTITLQPADPGFAARPPRPVGGEKQLELHSHPEGPYNTDSRPIQVPPTVKSEKGKREIRALKHRAGITQRLDMPSHGDVLIAAHQQVPELISTPTTNILIQSTPKSRLEAPHHTGVTMGATADKAAHAGDQVAWAKAGVAYPKSIKDAKQRFHKYREIRKQTIPAALERQYHVRVKILDKGQPIRFPGRAPHHGTRAAGSERGSRAKNNPIVISAAKYPKVIKEIKTQVSYIRKSASVENREMAESGLETILTRLGLSKSLASTLVSKANAPSTKDFNEALALTVHKKESKRSEAKERKAHPFAGVSTPVLARMVEIGTASPEEAQELANRAAKIDKENIVAGAPLGSMPKEKKSSLPTEVAKARQEENSYLLSWNDIDSLSDRVFNKPNLVLRLGDNIEIGSSEEGHSFNNNNIQWAEIGINQAGTDISTVYLKQPLTPFQEHRLQDVEDALSDYDIKFKKVIL